MSRTCGWTRPTQTLPSDPSAAPIPEHADSRWHAAFCAAARDCFDEMSENDLLILGLRLRYRMSQRECGRPAQSSRRDDFAPDG